MADNSGTWNAPLQEFMCDRLPETVHASLFPFTVLNRVRRKIYREKEQLTFRNTAKDYAQSVACWDCCFICPFLLTGEEEEEEETSYTSCLLGLLCCLPSYVFLTGSTYSLRKEIKRELEISSEGNTCSFVNSMCMPCALAQMDNELTNAGYGC